MTHDATKYQRRLADLGYLAADQVDGVFGPISLAAYNHYRATKGLPPVTTTTIPELERTLFPKPAVFHTADPNWLVRLGVNLALNQILKGTPIVNFLAGYKTYIVAALSIAVGLAAMVGVNVPGINAISPSEGWALVLQGLGFAGLRLGIAAK